MSSESDREPGRGPDNSGPDNGVVWLVIVAVGRGRDYVAPSSRYSSTLYLPARSPAPSVKVWRANRHAGRSQHRTRWLLTRRTTRPTTWAYSAGRTRPPWTSCADG